MSIRLVKENDCADWAQMREALWPAGPGRHAGQIADFFAGKRKEPLEALIALDGQGKAVGFIELSIRAYAEGCDTDRVAYVEGWYVKPEVRRSGIGAALVRAAEAWARTKGCTEFASDTEADNNMSVNAHHAVGFEEVGTIRCFKKTL